MPSLRSCIDVSLLDVLSIATQRGVATQGVPVKEPAHRTDEFLSEIW